MAPSYFGDQCSSVYLKSFKIIWKCCFFDDQCNQWSGHESGKYLGWLWWKSEGFKEQSDSVKAKYEQLSAFHSKSVRSLQNVVVRNEQYERRVCLILSGPRLPTPRNQKRKMQRIRSKSDPNTSETQPEPNWLINRSSFCWDPSNSSTKRNIIFNLCRRDLIWYFFRL